MRLRHKLFIALLIIAFIPAIGFNLITFNSSKEITKKLIFKDKQVYINQQIKALNIFIDRYIYQTKVLSQYPPIQGIIRSEKTGFDPEDKSSIEQWKDRLRRIFKTKALADPNVLQLRYIDENGMELVRINSSGSDTIFVSDQQLQDKSQSEYFLKTMSLEKGEIFVSSIELNLENGKIQVPHIPVMRIATPIFSDENNSRQGIMIINILAHEIIDQLITDNSGTAILSDEKGHFLFHPDNNKLFGNQLNHSGNYFKEQPELAENIKNLDFRIHHDIEEKELRVWEKIFYNPSDKSKFWILSSAIGESEAFAPINELQEFVNTLTLILFICLLIIAYITSKSVSKPVESLKKFSDEVADGNYNAYLNKKLLKRDDEIGEMSNSLQQMTSKLIESNNDLEKQVQDRIKQIKKTEAKAQIILETAADGIFTTDEIGTIKTFNPSAERMFNYNSKEIIGKSIDILLANTYKKELSQFLSEEYNPCSQKTPIDQDTPKFEHEMKGMKKDGDVFPIYLSLGKACIEGKKTFTGIVRDITELKKVEKMKNEFVSVVSHELRTPLTSIRGSLGLVAGGATGDLSDKTKEMVDIAVNNSDRLIRLINDILDIEKIESGKMEIELKPINLLEIIEQTVKSNQGYADQHHINFIIKDDHPEIKINADQDALTQILTNLLSNAAKFSPKDSNVEIIVDRIKDKVQVSVKDYGPGIPENFQDKIFDKFAQSDSSDSRQKGGTGLGLSISKALIEKMGGGISFRTEINEGTTFTIEIQEIEQKERYEILNINYDRPRILICDDDYDSISLISYLLKSQNFEVDSVYKIKDALELLDKHNYSGIILDLILPDGDGTTIIEKMKNDEKNKNIPIIVLSLKASSTKNHFSGNTVNVVDWLDKPINPNRILSAVKKTMKHDSDKPSILYVEDDIDTAKIVKEILKDISNISVATTYIEADKYIDKNKYDLVILDIGLPDGSGLKLLPKLNTSTGSTPTVLYSAQEVNRSVAKNVRAALLKSQTSNEKLLSTIKDILITENKSC